MYVYAPYITNFYYIACMRIRNKESESLACSQTFPLEGREKG